MYIKDVHLAMQYQSNNSQNGKEFMVMELKPYAFHFLLHISAVTHFMDYDSYGTCAISDNCWFVSYIRF